MSTFYSTDKDDEAASGQSVYIATTSYDNPDSSYTFSIQKTREAMHLAGIPTAYTLLQGNCHVDDARNNIVQDFLLSDCTDLVFIDADVSWKPEDLIKLCRYDCDLIGGVYPFRREGSSKTMPVRLMEGARIDDDGLIEVEGLPTGFMRIRRHVIETLVKGADHYRNRGELRSQAPILFERVFKDGTRWGGDLNFCNKWRATGGKIYAAADLVLGHAIKRVIKDSLAAFIRRNTGATYRYMADEIRAGRENLDVFVEARQCLGNEFSALEETLIIATILARKADRPIIEAGSGLTTIVLAAAAPDQTVYCLEHDEIWAMQVEKMASEAGVSNIEICRCPIVDGWYDLTGTTLLDRHYSVGLNDGPPRELGSRMGFFEKFGGKVDTILVDDTDDDGYSKAVEGWGTKRGLRVDFVGVRTGIIRRQDGVGAWAA